MLRNLDNLNRVFTGLTSPSPDIAAHKCSLLRHKQSKCKRCVDNCPKQAITISRTISIEKELCAGCGICAALCPNGVFELSRFSPDSIIDAVKSHFKKNPDRTLNYSCSEQSSTTGALKVPCLAGLGEAALLLPFIFGAENVSLYTGQCFVCELSTALTVIEETVDAASHLLNSIGRPAGIALSADPDLCPIEENSHEVAPAFDRRDFFYKLKKKTAGAVCDLVQLEETESEISRDKIKVPAKTKLLVSVLKALGKPANKNISAEDISFTELRISDSCTGCGYCAFFCPTQALEFAKTDTEFALNFNPADCTGCNLCLDICAANSVHRNRKVDLTKIFSDETDVIFEKDVAGRSYSAGSKAWGDLFTYLYH